MYKDLHIFEEAYTKQLSKKRKPREVKIANFIFTDEKIESIKNKIKKKIDSFIKKEDLVPTPSLNDGLDYDEFVGLAVDELYNISKIDPDDEISMYKIADIGNSIVNSILSSLKKPLKETHGGPRPEPTPKVSRQDFVLNISPERLLEFLVDDIDNLVEFLQNHPDEEPLDSLSTMIRVLTDARNSIRLVKKYVGKVEFVPKHVLDIVENNWANPIIDFISDAEYNGENEDVRPPVSDTQGKPPKLS